MKNLLLITLIICICGCQSTSNSSNRKSGVYKSKYNEMNKAFKQQANDFQISKEFKGFAIAASNKEGFILLKNPWNENITEAAFKNGKKHGVSITYGNDGIWRTEAYFVYGVEHGVTKQFRNNSLRSTFEYNCGIPMYRVGFDRTGQKSSEVEFINGESKSIHREFQLGKLVAETEKGFLAINHVTVPKFAQFDLFSKEEASRKKFPPRNGWKKRYDPKTGRLISEMFYLYDTQHGEQYTERQGFGLDVTTISTYFLGRKTSIKSERNIVEETILTKGEDKHNLKEEAFPLSAKERKKLKQDWFDSIKEIKNDHKNKPNMYNDIRDNSACLKVI